MTSEKKAMSVDELAIAVAHDFDRDAMGDENLIRYARALVAALPKYEFAGTQYLCVSTAGGPQAESMTAWKQDAGHGYARHSSNASRKIYIEKQT